MSFEYDDLSIAFSGLSQPMSQSTTLFGGGVPGVQFAPVQPIHSVELPVPHGPEFRAIYHAAPVHAHSHAVELHAIVGHDIDVRG